MNSKVRSTPTLDPAVIELFKLRFGDQLRTDEATRRAHSHQTTVIAAQAPDAVLQIRALDDVVDGVRLAGRHLVPVVPFGAGTSLEGQVNAPYGGIAFSFQDYNQLVGLDHDDLAATVHPGITRQQLNRQLGAHGLFFAVDPGSEATIGGMAGTRASGTQAVRYGTMRTNIVAAEVVLADATVCRVGGRAPKSAAGYDLLPLMIGSEGTLGIFTELTLRVHPIPKYRVTAVAQFPDLQCAIQTVVQSKGLEVEFARVELLDEVTVKACNQYSGIGLQPVPTILAEFSGPREIVEIYANMFTGVSRTNGSASVEIVRDQTAIARTWRARHDAWWAIHTLFPGLNGLTTDTCVPVAGLPHAVRAASRKMGELGLDGAIVGHIGDGNFHVLLMFDGANDETCERVSEFVDHLNQIAWELGGTCSGEHGVGQGKARAVETEHASSMGMMRSIKDALDPRGILNPGKLVRTEWSSVRSECRPTVNPKSANEYYFG